jgi:glycosyltransferase involved in cell wall biosynthesis
MSPLVNAIVPAYNYGRFLDRALDSVLSQTYSAVQCVVVDDGSTDETAEVLKRFRGRVTAIVQPHRGVSAARNAAIAASHGELIAFLDGDDYWHPTKIERQVAWLTKNPDVACIGCGLEHVYPDGRIERIPGNRNTDVTKAETVRRLARREFWIMGSGSGAMIRRSALAQAGGFDERLTAAEDWDLWLRVASQYAVDNVEDVLVSINRHGTGLFRNARLMEAAQWQVYQSAVQRWPHILRARDRRYIQSLILADAARESRDRWEALNYYARALWAWPLNRRILRAAAIQAVRQIMMSGQAAPKVASR